MIQKRFAVLVASCDGKFLVRQRPAGAVNGGLWEFPNHEAPFEEEGSLDRALELAGELRPRPLMRLKHSITKYRISLEVFEGTTATASERAGLDGVWHTLESLGRLAFASAHRKILRKIESLQRSNE
jgi:A/G-specific adenine glycosylase